MRQIVLPTKSPALSMPTALSKLIDMEGSVPLISIGLELLGIPHGRSRVDKKVRAILRGGRGGRPSLCMCFKGYCSPLTSLVELLNSLLGALHAFRTPTPLSEPDPLGSRRSADERSFPSIPSLPWSVKEKLISVVWGRCYALFTLAKVVLFCGLFFSFSGGPIFKPL